MAGYGIEMNSFASWALRYENSYPKLYWSDTENPQNGTKIVMAYTFETGRYTVWKVNINGGKIGNEAAGGQLGSLDPEQQTYENALETYKELSK